MCVCVCFLSQPCVNSSLSHYFALTTIGRFCDSEPCPKTNGCVCSFATCLFPTLFWCRTSSIHTSKQNTFAVFVSVDFEFESLFDMCIWQCNNRRTPQLFQLILIIIQLTNTVHRTTRYSKAIFSKPTCMPSHFE